MPPRRAARARSCRALFDLEPVASRQRLRARVPLGSAASKRAFVLVLTDLLDEAAAQPLLDALPVLARRHAVAVASVDRSGARRDRAHRAGRTADVYRTAVALDVLAARAARRGAAPRGSRRRRGSAGRASPAACVRAYLRAKSLALQRCRARAGGPSRAPPSGDPDARATGERES